MRFSRARISHWTRYCNRNQRWYDCQLNQSTRCQLKMQQMKQRDRQIRNSQLKLQWDSKYQKITEAGVLCGERPWHLCDQKCVSLMYLSISTKGRRLLTQKFPHDNIYNLTILKLWEMMEITSIRPRNIKFDRYVFFSRKQKKGETVEQFYSILKEFSATQLTPKEHLVLQSIWKWAIRISREYHQITAQLAMRWM